MVTGHNPFAKRTESFTVLGLKPITTTDVKKQKLHQLNHIHGRCIGSEGVI